MKDRLVFNKMDDLREAWFVENSEGMWIGSIVKGKKFNRRFVLNDVEHHAEYTSENLKQVAAFIDTLEKGDG